MQMDIGKILKTVEMSIRSKSEREYFFVHEERYRKILQQIDKVTNSQNNKQKKVRILDVGCFPYHLGAALEKLGHEVWGIASAHEPIHSKRIKVCNVERDRFPFADNFFDLVLCTEVLEHLPQSPAHALSESRRVAKPGGHLLVTTPNIARLINRIKLLLGKNVSYPLSHILEEDNMYHRHNREYTLSELAALCEHARWKTTKKERFISYTPMRKRKSPIQTTILKWLYYFLVLPFPPFQDTLLVIGKK